MAEVGYAAEYQPVVLSGVTELLVVALAVSPRRTPWGSRIRCRWPGMGRRGSTAGPMSSGATVRPTPGVG